VRVIMEVAMITGKVPYMAEETERRNNSIFKQNE